MGRNAVIPLEERCRPEIMGPVPVGREYGVGLVVVAFFGEAGGLGLGIEGDSIVSSELASTSNLGPGDGGEGFLSLLSEAKLYLGL